MKRSNLEIIELNKHYQMLTKTASASLKAFRAEGDEGDEALDRCTYAAMDAANKIINEALEREHFEFQRDQAAVIFLKIVKVKLDEFIKEACGD